jgi:hypothetical protein
MSEGTYCNGGHRLHVADVAVVQEEGKVCILAICLDCGKGFKNEHFVARPSAYITALETSKEKSNVSLCK